MGHYAYDLCIYNSRHGYPFIAGHSDFLCSNCCGSIEEVYCVDDFKFCPFCGAKLREYTPDVPENIVDDFKRRFFREVPDKHVREWDEGAHAWREYDTTKLVRIVDGDSK